MRSFNDKYLFCRRSRRWLCILLLLFTGTLSIVLSLPSQERVPLLWHAGVPAAKVLWLDLRVIAAGIEAQDAGRDPYGANPADPLNRVFNYPRVWLVAHFLGNESTLVAFALVQSAAAGFVLVWLVGRLPWTQGLLLAPFLFSPAIVLLVERSNTDLTIFALLGMAAIQSSWRSSGWRSSLLIALAGVLKLYPAVTFAVLVRRRQTKFTKVASLLVVIVTFAWLIFDHESTSRALAATPVALASYGVSILSRILARIYELRGQWQDIATVLRIVTGLLLAAGLYLGIQSSQVVRFPKSINMAETAFLMSSLLYIGTFVIGASFDYRLVFIFLGIRYIFRQSWQERSNRPWIVGWWLTVVLLLWSSPLFGYWSIVVHQVASAGLVPILGYFDGRMFGPRLKSQRHRTGGALSAGFVVE